MDVTSDDLIVLVDATNSATFIMNEFGVTIRRIDCKAHVQKPTDIAAFGKWSTCFFHLKYF